MIFFPLFCGPRHTGPPFFYSKSLNRHRLGEIPGLVRIIALGDGDKIREKLERDDA